jgi:glycosyltransferase involved in cell wall biosynthesis
MKKILFLGPKTNVKRGLVGGATMSFGYLVDYFKSRGDNIKVLNTKRFFGFLSGPFNAVFVLAKLIYLGFWADIIFLNSSRGGTKHLAPLVSLVALFYGNKFVFRPFGGDMKDYTSNYGALGRWMFKKSVLEADLLYLQTKELMNFYASSEVNMKQLMTSRKRPLTKNLKSTSNFEKRFIFLGFVNDEKGIKHLLEAHNGLDPSYTIHIYGPIKDAQYRNLNEEVYKGVLKQEEVLATLKEYDVLVLPTFYEGEGYPGVIIEAYSLGIPVVTTNWKAIPEIVEDGETGFIIEPRSTEALLEGIKRFNKENYKVFANNALQYFSDTFDEEIVLEKVRQDLMEL